MDWRVESNLKKTSSSFHAVLPRILPVRGHAETRARQLIVNHPHLASKQALNVIQTKLIPDWEVDSGQNGLFLERVGKHRNQLCRLSNPLDDHCDRVAAAEASEGQGVSERHQPPRSTGQKAAAP